MSDIGAKSATPQVTQIVTSPPGAVRLKRMATAMLALGGAAFVASIALGLGHAEMWWAKALLHGLEGAIVGGLCDWFAVEKTYHAVKIKRDEVADGLGRWVSSELLSAHVIRQRLVALLDDPEIRQKAYTWLDSKLGSVEETNALIESAWSKVEPHVVEFVSNYDLSTSELGIVGDAFKDESVIEVVGRCLGSGIVGAVDSPEFGKLMNEAAEQQGLVARIGMAFANIPAKLKSFGLRLRSEPLKVIGGSGSLGNAITSTLRVGASSFVAEWNAMDVEQRNRVVQAVLRHLRKPVIAATARFLIGERDHLRKVEALRSHPRAHQLAGIVENYVTQGIADALGGFVSKALKTQEPEETAQRLRYQTEEHLTWIRINGTALGFAIGTLLGATRGLLGL